MSITIQILSYTHRQKQGIDAQTLVKKIGLAETVSGKLRQMQSMGWTKADERGRLSLTPRGEFFAKLFAKTKAVLAWGDGG